MTHPCMLARRHQHFPSGPCRGVAAWVSWWAGAWVLFCAGWMGWNAGTNLFVSTPVVGLTLWTGVKDNWGGSTKHTHLPGRTTWRERVIIRVSIHCLRIDTDSFLPGPWTCEHARFLLSSSTSILPKMTAKVPIMNSLRNQKMSPFSVFDYRHIQNCWCILLQQTKTCIGASQQLPWPFWACPLLLSLFIIWHLVVLSSLLERCSERMHPRRGRSYYVGLFLESWFYNNIG